MQKAFNPAAELARVFYIEAGIATIKSMDKKEAHVDINLTLKLRPSVIEVLANMQEKFLLNHLEKATKEKLQTQGLSIFLSDAIDQGILSKAHHIAKQNRF